MTRERVQAWLDAYVDAWRSYDADAIGDLFSDDAEYRYHPYDEPLRGRQAIVDDWLGDRDESGSWEAAYTPLLVDGDRAVATGETRYAEGRTFSNIFVLAFEGEGRCREFTEWYMEHPKGRTSAG
jgi:ketosteroid isomerase-like protein